MIKLTIEVIEMSNGMASKVKVERDEATPAECVVVMALQKLAALVIGKEEDEDN